MGGHVNAVSVVHSVFWLKRAKNVFLSKWAGRVLGPKPDLSDQSTRFALKICTIVSDVGLTMMVNTNGCRGPVALSDDL